MKSGYENTTMERIGIFVIQMGIVSAVMAASYYAGWSTSPFLWGVIAVYVWRDSRENH